MKIELVVFDLAGTTVKDNSDVSRILKQSLEKQGVLISMEQANAVMGIPKPIAIRDLLQSNYKGDRIIEDRWIQEIHEQFVADMIDFYKSNEGVSEKPGVSKTFRALKDRGIKVAVDTGFDRPITTPLLARLGWVENGLIDCSITSDEVQHGRPYPDMIFAAMEKTGVENIKAVAKVGDTASDMQQGTAAGCAYVIGVTTGAYSREALLQEPHTHLVSQAEEVLDIIGG